MPRHTILSPSFLFLLAAAILAAPGCRTDAPPAEIRFGLLALMEGLAQSTSGRPSIDGAELAVKTANDAGGILVGGVRRRVALVVKSYDDRPDSATSVARALINQERIDVLLGPQLSRHAIPVSLVAENGRVPMMSPMSSNPETTRGKKYVFRLAFLDDEQAKALARFARQELAARTAAALYDVSTANGRSLATAFEEEFAKDGGRVVANEVYARDEPLDYSAQLERIAVARPQVLYLAGDTDRVVTQIVQARKQGIEATLLGADTWDIKFLETLPESDGAFYTHQWHHELDDESSRRFVELYRQTYGETPKATAAVTYDAVQLCLEAIEEAGSTAPDRIREALARPRSFHGVTGDIRFDGSPDPIRKVIISRIHDGRSEFYRAIEPRGL
jgi:branched-chain amino acid transport system substrate-binding protein